MAPQPQNEYFAELLAGEQLLEKIVEQNGRSLQVWFRQITAAERVKLLVGKRVNVGEKNTMDVDIADVVRNRHQLVQFSACRSDGSPLFKSIGEVQALPDWLANQLAEYADEANKDRDAGKP